jgi:SAM-dependent methyltransferase
MSPDCPVCGTAPAVTLVERRNIPIFFNRVYDSRDEARAVTRGDVVFVECAACGHAWNRAFEPDKLVFDASYNHHMGSPAFDRHTADVADRIERSCANLEPIDLLEIGCGQGDFLRQMVGRFGARLRRGRGYDPAFRRADSHLGDPRIEIERRYFDDVALASFDGTANVVVSRQVVQHVAEPRRFFKSVHRVMSPGGKLLIEAPDVAWILEHKATYDLFYEHCSLYSKASMARVLRDAGFAVSAITPVFQDQYMLAIASADGAEDRYAAPAIAPPKSLAEFDRQFVDGWKARLRVARVRGPVFLWGGAAKGVSFCTLVDPEGVAIDSVIDINPRKQGRFVAGSGHAVISPDAPALAGAKTVIVSNANYKAEITMALTARGYSAEVLTLDNAP